MVAWSGGTLAGTLGTETAHGETECVESRREGSAGRRLTEGPPSSFPITASRTSASPRRAACWRARHARRDIILSSSGTDGVQTLLHGHGGVRDGVQAEGRGKVVQSPGVRESGSPGVRESGSPGVRESFYRSIGDQKNL